MPGSLSSEDRDRVVVNGKKIAATDVRPGHFYRMCFRFAIYNFARAYLQRVAAQECQS